MAKFTALLDACVLYPYQMRDLLLQVASDDIYRARWTNQIHEEWTKAVKTKNPHLNDENLARTRGLMNKAVEDCLVEDYENLIPSLELPDADDRHVLAAAIVGRADAIITSNIAHFPNKALEPYGIEVLGPDVFLNHQRTLNEPHFIACVRTCRARLKSPEMTPDEYIDSLRRCQLTLIAEELEKVKALI